MKSFKETSHPKNIFLEAISTGVSLLFIAGIFYSIYIIVTWVMNTGY